MSGLLNQGTRPRIAIGGILHETHSFAETPTELTEFQDSLLYYGEEMLQAMAETRSGLGGMITESSARGWTLLPTVYGTAMPGGIVVEAAYQAMLTELIGRLVRAGPIDGVLLLLHGAMVTEQHLDAESHILEQVRQVVGPAVPIVVELDMHGNISPLTVELADVLVAYDTNPHVDPYARGIEAVTILTSLLDGSVRPTAALARANVLLPPQETDTADLLLRAVHERSAELEAREDIVCISVMAGFAYADTPFTGPSIIVTANNKADLARRCAQELVEILHFYAEAARPEFLTPEQAVARALAAPAGPIILVDSADNIGGGTPGDGTDALKAMLALGVREGTVVLADPAAVKACWSAGKRTEINLAVGGKSDRWHGEPVAVTGVVRALTDGVCECELPDNHFASFYGTTIEMGRTAWLRVAGVNVILTEKKTPPFDLAQLRSVGLIPEEQKMIVVKSAVAYRTAYLPIAARVIEMDTAGLCTANLARFPYQHLPRSIFPSDARHRSQI
jgi:microcystin degradation protein MlrC